MSISPGPSRGSGAAELEYGLLSDGRRNDPRRFAICKFAMEHTREHGEPPTLRQVVDHVGLRSTSSVYHHLKSAGMLGLILQASRTL
ncbi:hypothetical protein [Streptomyces boninensis]|uniref:LexA family protein n=1 Tax=Streptomyces boninensis TaxID=2039455 RepID=UPI003B2122FE